MLIVNYNLPPEHKSVLRIGDTANVLIEPALSDAAVADAKLVIWRGALEDQRINDGMSSPDWPVRFLSSLVAAPVWRWRARHSGLSEPLEDRLQIVALTLKASGSNEQPLGNIVTKLSLRQYHDDASEIGGREWWTEHNKCLSKADEFTRSVCVNIEAMLEGARAVGADLCVERLALIVGKDPRSTIATLTPQLHGDESYGYRETALCSLLEQGYNSFGGTLFFPTETMATLRKYGRLTIDQISSLPGDIPVLITGSGDVAYYDGMLNSTGKGDETLGAPHLSPDVPGDSSRLILLMRNKKLPRRAKP